VVELDLERNQRVVSLSLRSFEKPERKTVDWSWVAVVETRLPPPPA
jgi:hypothetical protein